MDSCDVFAGRVREKVVDDPGARLIRLWQLIRPMERKDLTARVGDKVRLKSGARKGERAVVEALEGDRLKVRLAESTQLVRVLAEEVTNFSLAARKAWVTGPDRAVG